MTNPVSTSIANTQGVDIIDVVLRECMGSMDTIHVAVQVWNALNEAGLLSQQPAPSPDRPVLETDESFGPGFSHQDYLRATEAGRLAQINEYRAASATYDAGTDTLHIDTRRHGSFAIPRSAISYLQGATAAQLAKVEVWAGGDCLAWDELDIHLKVDRLVRDTQAALGPEAMSVPAPGQVISCTCTACSTQRARALTAHSGIPVMPGPSAPGWSYACAACGNKRCPHHADHRFVCTASNELDQVGVLA